MPNSFPSAKFMKTEFQGQQAVALFQIWAFRL